MNDGKKPLELYIHIPFCERKCAYCDFLSMPATLGVQRQYVEKLIDEIIGESAGIRDYEVTSVFLGGGTPSILPGEYILGILQATADYFNVKKDAEITIEINPGTLDEHKLECYRKAGINRISLGLQSSDDWELKILGRIHTYDDFLRSYEQVRMAGFSNVNVDLMSALPGQTLDSCEKTLKKVLMLRPEHISAYSLIIEEGTPFYEKYGRGEKAFPPLPDEDTEREMYHVTRTMMEDHGYHRYEISNYCRSGFECRHNLGYWTGVEYLGLGLGASSCISGFRFKKEENLRTYMEQASAPDFPSCLYREIHKLDVKDRMEEFMFLGLRLTEGVSGAEFHKQFGQNMWNVYGPVIEEMEKNGLLASEPPRIFLTERGMDLSNYVMSHFLLD